MWMWYTDVKRNCELTLFKVHIHIKGVTLATTRLITMQHLLYVLVDCDSIIISLQLFTEAVWCFNLVKYSNKWLILFPLTFYILCIIS